MPPIPSFGVNLADDTNAIAAVSGNAIDYLDNHPDDADLVRIQRQSVQQGEDTLETRNTNSQRLLGIVQDTRSAWGEAQLGPKVRGGRAPVDPEAVARTRARYEDAHREKAEYDAATRPVLIGLGGDREVLAGMNKVIEQLARSGVDPERLPDISLPDGHPLDVLKSAVSTRTLLLADRKVRNDAPEPEEVVLQRLLKEVPEDDAFGLPPITFRKRREGFSWPVEAVAAAPSDSGDAGIPHVRNYGPLVMRLGRDLLRDHIIKSVREHYAQLTGVTPLSDEDRAAKLADIEAKLLVAERIEVEATWAARAAGLYVPFRADINVRTVLGIQ